jgi:hypothetical protein
VQLHDYFFVEIDSLKEKMFPDNLPHASYYPDIIVCSLLPHISCHALSLFKPSNTRANNAKFVTLNSLYFQKKKGNKEQAILNCSLTPFKNRQVRGMYHLCHQGKTNQRNMNNLRNNDQLLFIVCFVPSSLIPPTL